LVSEFACGATLSQIDERVFGKLQRLKAVLILRSYGIAEAMP
jgi:hypothetical protein